MPALSSESTALRQRLADLEASIQAEQLLRAHMVETLKAKGLELDAELVEAGSLLIASDLAQRRSEVVGAIDLLAGGQRLDQDQIGEIELALAPRPRLSPLEEEPDTIESLEAYLLERSDLELI